MGPVVRAILVWLGMLLLTVAFAPLTLVLSLTIPFDRRRRVLLWESHLWCRTVGRCYPMWKLEFSGLEHVEPGRHYVVMSNHASFADILLLSFLPLHYRWVSKREIFLVPLFGWQMWVFGHLSVKRRDKRSVDRFMRAARRTLESGLSILVFPEGTRTRTGELGSFKPGGFQLASDTGTPVLPVVLGGSRDALPKQSWIPRRRTYPRVHVLPPIPVTRGEPPEEISARVRAAILEHLPRIQRESADLLAAWLARTGLKNPPDEPDPLPPAAR
jgi:1-acyl-sn-glycerol-3-phosphate acyltransferase